MNRKVYISVAAVFTIIAISLIIYFLIPSSLSVTIFNKELNTYSPNCEKKLLEVNVTNSIIAVRNILVEKDCEDNVKQELSDLYWSKPKKSHLHKFFIEIPQVRKSILNFQKIVWQKGTKIHNEPEFPFDNYIPRSISADCLKIWLDIQRSSPIDEVYHTINHLCNDEDASDVIKSHVVQADTAQQLSLYVSQNRQNLAKFNELRLQLDVEIQRFNLKSNIFACIYDGIRYFHTAYSRGINWETAVIKIKETRIIFNLQFPGLLNFLEKQEGVFETRNDKISQQWLCDMFWNAMDKVNSTSILILNGIRLIEGECYADKITLEFQKLALDFQGLKSQLEKLHVSVMYYTFSSRAIAHAVSQLQKNSADSFFYIKDCPNILDCNIIDKIELRMVPFPKNSNELRQVREISLYEMEYLRYFQLANPPLSHVFGQSECRIQNQFLSVLELNEFKTLESLEENTLAKFTSINGTICDF